MDGASISYFPTAKTLSSISECILELVKMRTGIFQLGDRPYLGLTPYTILKHMLCIKSNVVFRLEMLFKGTVEDGQNPPPTSHLPPSATLYDSPTAEAVFSTTIKCTEQLFEMQRLILHGEESLSQSELLDKVLHIKSIVVSQLEILFKKTKEGHEEALDDDYDDDEDDEDDDALVQGQESVGQQKMEGVRWSSVHGMKDTKGRYLCLSNGYEIWCLDLKQSSSNTDPGPLPIISTLNLLGAKLATSVGLFNLGSDAYIIGGKKLPASLEERDSCNPTCQANWGFHPKGMDLYKALCYTRGAKGSSRVTYRLSLDADKDGTLSLSKGDIEKLNNPKFWPIVENIDGKLHVMDSCPFSLSCDFYCKGFKFSHEVCEGRSGWKDIPTGGAIDHISSHVVVGDRIYTNTCKRCDGDYFLEFDSQTGEWERSPTGELVVHGFKVKIVWDILSLGIGRCAGEFLLPHEQDERVFVLFAIVRGRYEKRDGSVSTMAVAYLVTLTGLVICYQHVPNFFSKEECFRPCDLSAATMIHVDVDKDQEGTMCSVVSAAMRKDGRKKAHIFINTFSV